MGTIASAVREFGEVTPRVVAELESFEFSVEYMREDVEDVYSEDDLEEAYQLIMANQVTGDDFKHLIGRGRYDAQTLFFEDIVVFLFPSERYEAVFASFDFRDDFPIAGLIQHVSDARPDA